MLYCRRVSGAFDFRFRIQEFTQRRNDAKQVIDYLSGITTLPWFGIQSDEKERLNAQRALNGVAFQLLNSEVLSMENQQQ